MAQIHALASEVVQLAIRSKASIITAESCTGGGICQAITSVAGASACLEGGFVTYSNALKQRAVGVKSSTLDAFGAVSEQVTGEMVQGALLHSDASLAVSVSGIAGPGGAVEGKPVGTVCISWLLAGQPVTSRSYLFEGGRESVRQQTIIEALKGIKNILLYAE